MIQILLQLGERAITSDGGLSAEWVLVGITAAAFFLFWRMLYKIERGLEKVIGSVAIHETKLQLHDKSIEDLEEDVQYLKRKRG